MKEAEIREPVKEARISKHSRRRQNFDNQWKKAGIRESAEEDSH